MKKVFWASTKLVYLEIRTWIGVGIGAEHYYGTLNRKNRRNDWHKWDIKIDVKRILSKTDVAEFNRKDGYGGYKDGSSSDRFDNIDSLVKAAKLLFKKEFQTATYLIKGSSSIAQPQEVLIGPNKNALNDVFFEFDLLEWDHDEERMDELTEQWEALLKI